MTAFFILLTASTCRTADTTESMMAAIEQQVFQLVNEYRARLSLPSLQLNDTLADIARRHSRNMAQGDIPFGHDGFSQRVTEVTAQMDPSTVSENIGMISNLDSPAQAVVNAWAKSETHAKNLIGSFQLTGVGAAKREGNDVWYLTQIFVETRH